MHWRTDQGRPKSPLQKVAVILSRIRLQFHHRNEAQFFASDNYERLTVARDAMLQDILRLTFKKRHGGRHHSLSVIVEGFKGTMQTIPD